MKELSPENEVDTGKGSDSHEIKKNMESKTKNLTILLRI
tara:strand:- start:264 stop:380 length:117 start_codon:yes stop_codon:yes gene_type:complete